MSRVSSGPVEVLPREKVRAWRPWRADELVLDTPASPVGSAAAPVATEPEETPEQRAEREAAEQAAAQAAALEQLREEVRAQAYAEGLEQGRAEGHAQGFAQGEAEGRSAGHAQGLAEGALIAHQQAETLAALLGHCHDAATTLHEQVPATLLRVALSVAQKVIGSELHTRPEHILPWIENFLRQESVPEGVVKVHLHPEDVELVGAQLGPALADQGWRLVPDENIARGGCRLLTPLGELDATLQTRWKSACAASGGEPPWTLD